MINLHEQLHASVRISTFTSLLCAHAKYTSRSILDLFLWYPKNRNSKVQEMTLLAQLPFLIFVLLEGPTLLNLFNAANITCMGNIMPKVLSLIFFNAANITCMRNIIPKFCPLICSMLPTSLV